METDPSPDPSNPLQPPSIKIDDQAEPDPAPSCQNNGCDEADSTIHAFNMPNITVIENPNYADTKKGVSCEGSDSGVEGLETPETCLLKRTLSTNSQDFQQSCDSSIISCCSNYEEAYNILARRNSTLLEDYKLRSGDGTSEGGSESSSVAGSTRNVAGGRKKIGVVEAKGKTASTARSRSKTQSVTPKTTSTSRVQSSTDRIREKTPTSRPAIPKPKSKAPDNLSLKRSPLPRTRTPSSTPTDDGRWPSINSKPAPLMTRSLRGILPHDGTPKTHRLSSLAETNKTLEKYATLPRRRKEKSADSIKDLKAKSVTSRENSATRTGLFRSRITRDAALLKTLPPYPRKKPTPKVKIYHETSSQTALTCTDIEKAFAGEAVAPSSPFDVERLEKDVQVDMRLLDLERLQEELRRAKEKCERLTESLEEEKGKNRKMEDQLTEEKSEKGSLRKELQKNTERVLAILGGEDNYGSNDENVSSDSLMVLETRFQNVSQVVIKQEEEITKLNSLCRVLQRDLEKSIAAQKALLQQHQELEAESSELHEFVQAEKTALTDALKEVEAERNALKEQLALKDKELADREEEVDRLQRTCEQKRQENFSLHARMMSLEAKSRELLVQQGSVASGAAVALSALISRLNGLVEELVTSYNISEQELEDVIFHNEAYSNSSSSPEATPEKSKKAINDAPSTPRSASSYVSAIINAIRNAVAQSPFSYSADNTMNSSSMEMLDFETEPCLMMEHVLEDAVVQDGFSHNMISSGHSLLSSRLKHSESLNSLPAALFGSSLCASFASDVSSLGEICPSLSLVDQVIEVDNIITKLLKVIRIIQLENEDCMSEVQAERDGLRQQVEKQREANKTVGKQLKDWEILGARLKSEVKDLLHQLSNKNNEIDSIRSELNQQRKEVEKLNQDVCELSTALSKTELLGKTREEEAADALRKWEESGEVPASEFLGRLIVMSKEVPSLKEKLTEKEKRLSELTQEYSASRQVMSENLKEALNETKKLYEAIDNALDTLQNIQSVVQQCPLLTKLQRDLEETSFQTASSAPIVVPPDCNTNAALLQAMSNLEIAGPINMTA